MSTRILGVLTILMLAGIGAGLWLLERTEVHELAIAAGPESGEAFQVARAISTVTERYHPNIRIEVLETQGSEQSVAVRPPKLCSPYRSPGPWCAWYS